MPPSFLAKRLVEISRSCQALVATTWQFLASDYPASPEDLSGRGSDRGGVEQRLCAATGVGGCLRLADKRHVENCARARCLSNTCAAAATAEGPKAHPLGLGGRAAE
jgi:hypothetical protein